MKEIANAKINLALNVIRRREDGYHELESIMLPLAFGDDIILEECDKDYLTSNVTTIPLDERNLAFKALLLMKETYSITKNYHIHIEKHIPSEAGLGGGSSDAAAVMRLLNKMENLQVDIHELADLSVKLGADCPFCVLNKPMFISGIGEKYESINLTEFPYHVLLVKPSSGVSTKLAYEGLNIAKADHPNCKEIVFKLENKDFKKLGIANSLEESALRINSDVKEIKAKLESLGFDYVLMSGSGSSVFALTENEQLLEESYDFLKNSYEFVEKSKIIEPNHLNF
ncbi:MAG: 4-(cytidine 5'-diphospho)-2-C-methyl-D-erythritol kinase [Erysipelotrichales bacterium]|nr:4-(cytidine 5'-diphospho)-2-C-methyl-D-erythritol kinase [Erysipelotrichales bacterium]